MTGVFLINKPKGITSHTVVSCMRKILNTRRIGHAGTLDPMATGVLVVLVGKATKLSDLLLSEEKRYRAGILLGTITDTYDITGEILEENDCSVDENILNDVLESFKGEISQVPPIYSAIKKDGRKLYEYARSGEEIEVKPRKVTIHSISSPEENIIDVECSKGTYIRSLVHDIGKALGCGACLSSLERTKSGQFSIDMCCTLDDIRENGYERYMLSIDDCLDIPEIIVSGNNEHKMKNGNPIMVKMQDSGLLKVKDKNNEIICCGRVLGGKLRPEVMLYEGDI